MDRKEKQHDPDFNLFEDNDTLKKLNNAKISPGPASPVAEFVYNDLRMGGPLMEQQPANNDAAVTYPCFGSPAVPGHTARSATLYKGGRFECCDNPHQLCYACATHTHCTMPIPGHNGQAVPEQEEDLDTVDNPVEKIEDLNYIE